MTLELFDWFQTRGGLWTIIKGVDAIIQCPTCAHMRKYGEVSNACHTIRELETCCVWFTLSWLRSASKLPVIITFNLACTMLRMYFGENFPWICLRWQKWTAHNRVSTSKEFQVIRRLFEGKLSSRCRCSMLFIWNLQVLYTMKKLYSMVLVKMTVLQQNENQNRWV